MNCGNLVAAGTGKKVTSAIVVSAILGGFSAVLMASLAGLEAVRVAFAYPTGGAMAVGLLLCFALLGSKPAQE